MRQTAGELTHRLHLLRLAKGFLDGLQRLGFVAFVREVATDRVDQAVPGACRPGDPAVAAIPMPVPVVEPRVPDALRQLARADSRALHVVGVDEVEQVGADQLGFGPTEHHLPGRVDGHDPALEVAAEHDVGGKLPEAVAIARPLRDLGLQRLVQRTKLARGEHLVGDLDALVQQPDDPAILATDRRGGEVPVGRLEMPAAGKEQLDVAPGEAVTGFHREVERGCDLHPGFAPDLGDGPTESGWMVRAHGGDVAVVVEHPQVRAPQDRPEQR